MPTFRLCPLAPAAALGAAVVIWLAAAPVSADAIAPASLVPALQVYVDRLAAGHLGAAACDDPGSPARDETAWTKARAILLATLWANGFPADNDLAVRLDAPAPAAKPDCLDPALSDSMATAEHEGWVKTVGHAISGMDLAAVSEPVGPDKWQAIKDAIAGDLPKQARMLDCMR